MIHEIQEDPSGDTRPLPDPVTICVACYGPHAALAERFLSSLYANTDPDRFTLRAGLNEAEPETHRIFRRYGRKYGNIEQLVETRNVFKSPLMRRLFHERPLTTRWTIWCDDDTHFTRPDWLPRLNQAMAASPEASMFGELYYLDCGNPAVLNWIRSASWYRSVPFVSEPGPHEIPPVRFVFATGGFWALRTRAIHQLAWPDPRLIHAGEDFLLSEALRQNGYRIAHFNEGVRINDAPRRNSRAPQVVELPRA